MFGAGIANQASSSDLCIKVHNLSSIELTTSSPGFELRLPLNDEESVTDLPQPSISVSSTIRRAGILVGQPELNSNFECFLEIVIFKKKLRTQCCEMGLRLLSAGTIVPHF